MKKPIEIRSLRKFNSGLFMAATIFLIGACCMAPIVATAAPKTKDEPPSAAPATSTPTTNNSAPARAQAEIISAALAQWSSKQLIMLYRQEAATAPNRLDPLTQAATRELEHEFLNRQYNIKQPSADVYRAMDKGPGVIVSFAPDAGLSMIYSVYGNVRPQPGTDVGIAEVRIEARVFVGSNLLSVEQGRGQVQTRIDPALREYGERRGYEIASQRAAAELVGQIDTALKALSKEQIAQMIADDTASSSFVVIEPPHTAPAPTPTTPPQAAPPIVTPTAPTTPAPPQTPPATVVPDTPAPTIAARKWLLDVGVGDYSRLRKPGSDSPGDLPGAPTDVKNIHQTMQGLGFANENIIELLNSQATAVAVRSALDDLKTKVGPDDLVVFFISGHGAQVNYKRAGNTLPIFYDFSPNGPPDFQELVERFSNIPAKNLVMLIDTCHSGGASTETPTLLVSSRGVEITKVSGSPNLAQIAKSVKGSRSNIAIMTAARPEESSWDEGSKVGGLFTKNVVMGLRSSRGTDTMQTLFERDVGPAVVDESRSICAKYTREDCPTGQQTPTLGFSGAGNAIRLSGSGQ